MNALFRMNPGTDVCLVPFDPVYEGDVPEIRVQVFNGGGDGTVSVSFFLDGEPIGSQTVPVAGQTYGFAHAYFEVGGKAGMHTVTVRLESSDGTVETSEASVLLEVVSERKPILDGGFLMLGPPNDRAPTDTFRPELKRFTDEDWRRYLDRMKEIGQNCLIVFDSQQYLSLEEQSLCAHYPSRLLPKSDIAAADPLYAILDEAQKNGQKVFVGLGNPFGYLGAAEEMRELYERYGSFSSFYGWYFATEMRMDVSEPERFSQWRKYGDLAACARSLAPVKPVMISPMAMPCVRFCRYMAEENFFDIIMPQDWVGQCAFHLSDSEAMHRELYTACRAAGKHLWANCESFNFTDTPDGKWENWGCTFAEFPWDAPRLLVPRFRFGGMVGEAGFDMQLKTVRPYVEKIMTFSLIGFFCPTGFTPVCGGEAAVRQYEAYAAYREKCLNGVGQSV